MLFGEEAADVENSRLLRSWCGTGFGLDGRWRAMGKNVQEEGRNERREGWLFDCRQYLL